MRDDNNRATRKHEAGRRRVGLAALLLCTAVLSSSAFSAAGRRRHLQFGGIHDDDGGAYFFGRSSGGRGRLVPVVSADATSSSLPRLEIEVQESNTERLLDEHSTLVLAARTDRCEGCLLRKDADHAFEAHLSCGETEKIDRVIAVFHRLLMHYLVVEHELYEKERDEGSPDRSACSLSVLLDTESLDASLSEELDRIGIPTTSSGGFLTEGRLGTNLERYMPFLNEFAFRNRGTEHGNDSLRVLQLLSRRRVPFGFSAHEERCEQQINTSPERRRRGVVSHQEQVLPPSAVEKVAEIVEEIKAKGWLSTNPDSVDGLPSLHLNLISNGRPLFEDTISSDTDGDDGSNTTPPFQQCISDMVDVLHPHLYEDLLPNVREMTGSSTVEISDVFIRNYGRMERADKGSNDGDDDDAKSQTRYGLSAHYDVTAYATCVMTLDSTASTGRNGLYTIPNFSGSGASGHAALRSFFPLDRGDGVVHTYDVLHGVDVDPDLDRSRTSLIVWFTDKNEGDDGQMVNQPWLLDPADDIGKFVLGLASESAVEEDEDGMMLKNAVDQYALYSSSAARGNAFATTSLAQMCDDDRVPADEYEKILSILTARGNFNPFLPSMNGGDGPPSCKNLAAALWYQAAIYGGHAAAQVSLADEIMLRYMTAKDDSLSHDEREDLLLTASALFVMAMAQGYDTKESMGRLMDVECGRLSSEGVEIPSEEFFRSPVVRTLLVFTSSSQ